LTLNGRLEKKNLIDNKSSMSTTATLSGLSGSGATVSWTPTTGATSYDIALYYKLSGAPTTSDTLVQTFTNRTSPATLSFTPNAAGGYYAATVIANYNSQISGTSAQQFYQPAYNYSAIASQYQFTYTGSANSITLNATSNNPGAPDFDGPAVFQIGILRGFMGLSMEVSFTYDLAVDAPTGDAGNLVITFLPSYATTSLDGQQYLTLFNNTIGENVTQVTFSAATLYGGVMSNIYVTASINPNV